MSLIGSVDDVDPAIAGSIREPPIVPAATRQAALAVLAVLVSLFALHWASAVFVPLLLGLMFSYALTPLVDRMVRLHLPRALAAGLLLLGIVGGAGSLAYSLGDDAAAMVEALPAAAQKVRRGLDASRSQGSANAMDRMQKAAAEVERSADQAAGMNLAPSRDVTKVQIERSRFNLKDYLWPGALGLAAAAAQAMVVLLITFFLLASGDMFRRKMIRIAGPDFGRKKLTLQAMDEVVEQIQRFLVVQVFASALVGVATWLAFMWLGIEHAAVWGAISFVLNFIPYLGAIVVTGASALTAYVQFGSFEMALVCSGAVFAIHLVVGQLVAPMLTSRASRMNPVAVFVGVLTWGWLWGGVGLLLGVPILLVTKAVCDRVVGMKAVGELLGE
jgi:predicted PurR-regulated permease PerM